MSSPSCRSHLHIRQHGDWPFALFPAKVPLRNEADKRQTASDRPSIQLKVRPTTVRPVLLRRKSYIVLRARILAPFNAHTKVAAFGRHHKRGAAAFGRATSFVVSFVCALTRASILALSTICDLRLSKTGRTVVGRTFNWMDGRSDAVSLLYGSFFKGTITRDYRFLNKWPVATSKSLKDVLSKITTGCIPNTTKMTHKYSM